MTIDETFFQDKNVLMLLNKNDYKRAYDFYMWLRPYIYGDNSNIMVNKISFQVSDEANKTKVMVVNIDELSELKKDGNVIQLQGNSKLNIFIVSKGLSFSRIGGLRNLSESVIKRQFPTFKRYATSYRMAVEKLIGKCKKNIKENK